MKQNVYLHQLFLRFFQEPVADLNPPVVKAGVEVGDSEMDRIISGWLV